MLLHWHLWPISPSGRRSRRFESSHPDHSGQIDAVFRRCPPARWCRFAAATALVHISCVQPCLDAVIHLAQTMARALLWMRRRNEVFLGQTDPAGRRLYGGLVVAQGLCAFAARGRAAGNAVRGHGALRKLRRPFAAQRRSASRRTNFLQRRARALRRLRRWRNCVQR